MFSFITEKVIRLFCGAKRLDHTNQIFHNIHILRVPDLVKLKNAIIITVRRPSKTAQTLVRADRPKPRSELTVHGRFVYRDKILLLY